MRKFERIRIEKGEPYIRDTGIRVLDVVAQILAGKTTSELLEKYPNLEVEDIVESLADSLRDTGEMISMAASDGRSPISSIINAIAILTDENSGLQDTDRKKLTDIIKQTAQRTLDLTNRVSDWVHAKYLHQLYPPLISPIKFSDIVEEVKLRQKDGNYKGDFHFNVPDDLPPVRSNDYLASAFIEILFFHIYSLKFGGTIAVENSGDNKLHVTITKKFESNSPNLDYLQKQFSSSGHLATFVLTVREHGSEMQITPSGSDLIIEFALPVWRENT